MILWIDAQLSPSLGPWIEESFGVTAQPIRDLGRLGAKDKEIFGQTLSAALDLVRDGERLVEISDARPQGLRHDRA